MLPNGTSITYKNKQLPDPDVGFPTIFGFKKFHLLDEASVLSSLHLLNGTAVKTIHFGLPASKADDFTVLPQIAVSDVAFYLPREDKHLPRLPSTIRCLRIGSRSLVTTEALMRQRLQLERFQLAVGLRRALPSLF